MAGVTNGSKAQAVRDYVSEHPRAKNARIVEALADKVDVTAAYVASIRRVKKMKKAAKKRARKGKKAAGGTGARLKKRAFPQVALKEALQVAQKIKELNGGNPWATDQVANAVGLGATTNNFYYLTASSRDFGLTTGTRNTPEVALTDFGRSVVYAPDKKTEEELKRKAFLSIELFQNVLEHYKKSDLPEMKYLGNTLESSFDLDPKYHEEFSRMFRENCDYLGIKSGISQVVDDTSGGDESEVSEVAKPTVILGEPKSGTTLKAFVMMPFVERDSVHPDGFFTEVLRSLITPAGVEAGFKVETANRQGSDLIQSTIINDLIAADLVIADLTEHNPNVLFELGIRMAKDKPVALIKATGTGRIFDVDNMLRVYEYNANLWRTTVEEDLPALTKHIKATWENRDSNLSYMKILGKGVE